MKMTVLHCTYEIPEKYKYVAFSRVGTLCGFVNAPVRDKNAGEWVDSVTRLPGIILEFDRWDQSCRRVQELYDRRYATPTARKKHESFLKALNQSKGVRP